MRATLVILAVLGVVVGNPASVSAQSKQSKAPATHIELQIGTVQVAPKRPGGLGAWDKSVEAKRSGGCSWLGTGAKLLGAAPAIGFGAAFLCNLFSSQSASERDARLPDLVVRITDGAGADYRTYVAADALQHVFNYPILIPLAAVPKTGIQISVIDQDGADVAKGEVLQVFRLFRAELEALAKSARPLRTLGGANQSVRKLEIIATPRRRARSRLVKTVKVNQAPKLFRAKVIAGTMIEIRTRGTYVVSSWTGKRIGPAGYRDGSMRQHNMRSAPFDKGAHGAAIAILGQHARMNVVVGRCILVVVPFSGRVALGVNDRKVSNNTGKVTFRIRSVPARAKAWRAMGRTARCVPKRVRR